MPTSYFDYCILSRRRGFVSKGFHDALLDTVYQICSLLLSVDYTLFAGGFSQNYILITARRPVISIVAFPHGLCFNLLPIACSPYSACIGGIVVMEVHSPSLAGNIIPSLHALQLFWLLNFVTDCVSTSCWGLVARCSKCRAGRVGSKHGNSCGVTGYYVSVCPIKVYYVSVYLVKACPWKNEAFSSSVIIIIIIIIISLLMKETMGWRDMYYCTFLIWLSLFPW